MFAFFKPSYQSFVSCSKYTELAKAHLRNETHQGIPSQVVLGTVFACLPSIYSRWKCQSFNRHVGINFLLYTGIRLTAFNTSYRDPSWRHFNDIAITGNSKEMSLFSLFHPFHVCKFTADYITSAKLTKFTFSCRYSVCYDQLPLPADPVPAVSSQKQPGHLLHILCATHLHLPVWLGCGAGHTSLSHTWAGATRHR